MPHRSVRCHSNPLSCDKGFLFDHTVKEIHRLMFKRLILTLGLLLAACAPAATPAPTPTPAALTLVDGLGRTVTLPGPAQRIVSLAPSNTEILFAIGAGPQTVGRDELSDYPEAAKIVASIGSTFGPLNTEVIVATRPDLVLAAEINSPEQVKALEDLGLAVFWLANPKDYAGLNQNLLTVGALTGHTAEAQALADSLTARVTAVTEKLKAISARPRVFYELDATDPTKPFTVGPGTFMDTMLTLAGAANVAAGLDNPYPQISSEELVQQNPEVILLGDAAFGVTAESVAQRPGWSALAAVKDNRILAFDDNLASRPGPRLVEGLEQLAKLLHPELFK
jgi:iron complex transport system substrate-binding protein